MNFELYDPTKDISKYNYWNISKQEFELLKKHIQLLEYFNFPTKNILDEVLLNKFELVRKILLNTEYEQDIKPLLELFKKYSTITNKVTINLLFFINKYFNIDLDGIFYIINDKKTNLKELKENQDFFEIKPQMFIENEKENFEVLKERIIIESRKKNMKNIIILTGDFIFDEKIIKNIISNNLKLNISDNYNELYLDYIFEVNNYRYNKYLIKISSYNLNTSSIINLTNDNYNYYGIFPVLNKNKNMKKIQMIEKFNYNRNKYKFDTLFINLDRRQDRLERFIKKYGDEYPNFIKFSAIDGKNFNFSRFRDIFDISEYNKYNNIKNPYPHHKNLKGVLGCSMSHYTIWNKIIQNNNMSDNDYVLVLEDDLDLIKDFNLKLNRLLEYLHFDDKWDVTFLGFTNYHSYEKVLKSVNNDIKKVEAMVPPGMINYFKNLKDEKINDMLIKFSGELRLNGGGTFAYIIRKKAAKKYIEFANKYKIQQPIDWYMIELFDKMTVYKCEPELVLSNIANDNKNADSDIQNLSEKFNFK